MGAYLVRAVLLYGTNNQVSCPPRPDSRRIVSEMTVAR